MIRLLSSFLRLSFTLLGLALALLPLLWRLAKWLLGIRPQPFSGRAYVLDGDSLAMEGDLRIRLWGLDAPEMSQPEGRAAKDHLTLLIGTHPLTILPKAKDKYGRLVAQVLLPDGTCVNERMVADGYARAYTDFTRTYARLERTAQREGRGLWGIGGLRLHPSLWRQHTR
jgi:endonuclease YncB( thermonuclease family)